jgi:hypothetical protein
VVNDRQKIKKISLYNKILILKAFIGSCIGLMIIAAIYEGIKSLREWLIKQDIKQIEYYNGRFQIFRYIKIRYNCLNKQYIE